MTRTGMELSMNHVYEPVSYGSWESWRHWSRKKTYINKRLDKLFEQARLATMLEF